MAVIVVLWNVILEDWNNDDICQRQREATMMVKMKNPKIFHLWGHVSQGHLVDRSHFLTSSYLGFAILRLSTFGSALLKFSMEMSQTFLLLSSCAWALGGCVGSRGLLEVGGFLAAATNTSLRRGTEVTWIDRYV